MAQIILLARMNCLTLEQEAYHAEMDRICHKEVVQMEKYAERVEEDGSATEDKSTNVREAWKNDSIEDQKMLKERASRLVQKKYLCSILESCQRSIKLYRIIGMWSTSCVLTHAF